jgi:hypothetical protein
VAIDDVPLTLARVWREMTPAQRTSVAQAFWQDDESMAQQVEAVTYLAKHLHFRPQSILGLPIDRKVKQLTSQTRLPDTVIGRALVVYHLSECRPMLAAFLDNLGIAHEDGLIADAMDAAPAADRLQAAAAALTAAFPADDVRLYLRTLAVQDPETWGALAAIGDTLAGSPA